MPIGKGQTGFPPLTGDAERRAFFDLQRKNSGLVSDLVTANAAIAALEARITALEDEFESGTYTPTLTAMVIGTGGAPSNVAYYTYSKGMLDVSGLLVFGTSGQTFPSGAVAASLPDGFAWSDVVDDNGTLGHVIWRDVTPANAYVGVCSTTSARTGVRFYRVLTSGTEHLRGNPSASAPHAWASNDWIGWHAAGKAVRV